MEVVTMNKVAYETWCVAIMALVLEIVGEEDFHWAQYSTEVVRYCHMKHDEVGKVVGVESSGYTARVAAYESYETFTWCAGSGETEGEAQIALIGELRARLAKTQAEHGSPGPLVQRLDLSRFKAA